MKKIIILISLILIIIVGSLLYWFVFKAETPKTLKFCDQFSGTVSYGFAGHDGGDMACIDAGCNVVNKEGFSDGAKSDFGSGYRFNCVPRD